MNRRQFVYTAAAAATPSRLPKILSAADKYDLVIKGGRVIDPSRKLNAIRDIGIAGGRIAAIESSIAAGAAETLAASGKLVVPGLIDIHTHAGRNAEASAMLLQDGVTGWIDGGSKGADGIADVVAVAKASTQPGRILINIGRAGIVPEGDTMDLSRADVNAARNAIAANREYVVGVKARLSRENTGANDVEVVKRSEEAAAPFNLPVMIHIGQSTSSLAKIMPLLKRGDIVTHMFAPPPNAIIDDNGRILPEVAAARRRGVIFDVGNGVTGHIRWDIVEKIMKAGFRPDTFSTDWNVNSRTSGVVDLANCMSKFFNYGMKLDEMIACATLNPSRLFPVFKDRGTLRVGAPADIAILELRSGEFEFVDNYQNTIRGTQRLFPLGSVLGGRWFSRAGA